MASRSDEVTSVVVHTTNASRESTSRIITRDSSTTKDVHSTATRDTVTTETSRPTSATRITSTAGTLTTEPLSTSEAKTTTTSQAESDVLGTNGTPRSTQIDRTSSSSAHSGTVFSPFIPPGTTVTATSNPLSNEDTANDNNTLRGTIAGSVIGGFVIFVLLVVITRSFVNRIQTRRRRIRFEGYSTPVRIRVASESRSSGDITSSTRERRQSYTRNADSAARYSRDYRRSLSDNSCMTGPRQSISASPGLYTAIPGTPPSPPYGQYNIDRTGGRLRWSDMEAMGLPTSSRPQMRMAELSSSPSPIHDQHQTPTTSRSKRRQKRYRGRLHMHTHKNQSSPLSNSISVSIPHRIHVPSLTTILSQDAVPSPSPSPDPNKEELVNVSDMDNLLLSSPSPSAVASRQLGEMPSHSTFVTAVSSIDDRDSFILVGVDEDLERSCSDESAGNPHDGTLEIPGAWIK